VVTCICFDLIVALAPYCASMSHDPPRNWNAKQASRCIYVASMVSNGSAQRDGRIREDDELVGINSVSVDHQTTLEELRSLILGPAGTFVMLSLRRPGGMNGDSVREDYWYFDVELQRSNSQDAPGGGDGIQILCPC
jgi:hypothetical protein